MIGCGVDLLLFDEAETRLIKTQIEQPLPLRLRSVGAEASIPKSGRRAMLLAHFDGLPMRADGDLDTVGSDGEGVWFEMNGVRWEVLERRRHVRVPVSVPVKLRLCDGDDDSPGTEIEGMTRDLSISGAFVKLSQVPEEGTLLEFEAEILGQTVRTLAVVARKVPECSGVGLQFVKYLEDARPQLHGFLTKAA